MKTSAPFAAAALLCLATTAIAQLPPGITPEMVASALPEEGAPKAVPGPYAVTSGPAFATPTLVIFHPAALEAFPARDRLPVVVWGHGGCALHGPRYYGFLETIASHGFLVVTTTTAETPAAGTRPRQATADDLKTGIDWAERENTRTGSPLQGKIDMHRVAAMGQSCGGMLSVALGADPRVSTIGVFNAGVQPPNPDGPPSDRPTTASLKALHGPVLLINGHDRDFMMQPSRATFDAIEHLPTFYGARHGAGHTATAHHAGGGEFANVASSWLRWHFKGNEEAGRLFLGETCGLCTDANWDTDSKRLGQARPGRTRTF